MRMTETASQLWLNWGTHQCWGPAPKSCAGCSFPNWLEISNRSTQKRCQNSSKCSHVWRNSSDIFVPWIWRVSVDIQAWTPVIVTVNSREILWFCFFLPIHFPWLLPTLLITWITQANFIQLSSLNRILHGNVQRQQSLTGLRYLDANRKLNNASAVCPIASVLPRVLQTQNVNSLLSAHTGAPVESISSMHLWCTQPIATAGQEETMSWREEQLTHWQCSTQTKNKITMLSCHIHCVCWSTNI